MYRLNTIEYTVYSVTTSFIRLPLYLSSYRSLGLCGKASLFAVPVPHQRATRKEQEQQHARRSLARCLVVVAISLARSLGLSSLISDDLLLLLLLFNNNSNSRVRAVSRFRVLLALVDVCRVNHVSMSSCFLDQTTTTTTTMTSPQCP